MHVALMSTLGGGVGRVTNHLIQVLSRKTDIDIDLFQIDNRREFNVDDLQLLKKKYHPRMKNNFLAKIESTCNLSLMSLKYDLIHCHYSSTAAFLRRYEGPMILTMHGFPRPEVEKELVYKMAYHFEQWCVRHLPRQVKLVTVSNYAKEAISNRYGLNAKVIYNGIDCDFFSPPPDKSKIKSTLGLSNKVVVLFVGRLHPLKDPITLLQAFELISKHIHNAVLIIIGTGMLEKEMMNVCVKKNIPVIFMGNLYGTELLSLYQSADVFAFTSLGDSLASVIAEAMACKCPCIASTSGSNSELVGRKELLVEPKNPKSLADSIIYLVEHPTYAEEISTYLHSRVKHLFSREVMAQQYYELYRNSYKN